MDGLVVGSGAFRTGLPNLTDARPVGADLRTAPHLSPEFA